MFKYLVIACLLVPTFVIGDMVIQDKNGDYRYYGQNGDTAVARDNGNNGYNVYQNNGETDQVIQNKSGSYSIYQNNQQDNDRPSTPTFPSFHGFQNQQEDDAR